MVLGWDRARGYQRRAALDLASGVRVGLHMAPGLGKTLTALLALQVADLEPPWLVLTSAMGRHVWPRDAMRFLGPVYRFGELWGWESRSPHGVHSDGTYSSLDRALLECAGVVTNYEVLQQRHEELAAVPWSALILDECHRCKGGFQAPERNARTGKLVRHQYHYAKELAVAVQRRGGVVWGLTATPIRDRRRDLWSQLDLVLPGPVLVPTAAKRVLRAMNEDRARRRLPAIWNSSLYTTLTGHVCLPGPFGCSLVYPEIEVPVEQATCFLRRYCGAHAGRYGLVHDAECNTDELNARLALHFVQLSRAEVQSELPALQFVVRQVVPTTTPTQSLGGGYENAIARAAETKFPFALEEAMDHLDQGERVLIVTSRRRLAHMGGALAEKAAQKLSRHIREALEISVITGDLPTRTRRDRFNAFNTGTGPALVIATIDCMYESIDVHLIPCVCVVGLPYTPGMLEQFIGRFARLGGNPVTVYLYLAEGTIDEEIRDILIGKLEDVHQLGADTTGTTELSDVIRAGGLTDTDVIAGLEKWLLASGEE